MSAGGPKAELDRKLGGELLRRHELELRAREAAEREIEHVDLEREATPAEMEAITVALTRMFVIAYNAGVEEATRSALGRRRR